MEREKEEQQRAAKERAEVNPAARHDRPGDAKRPREQDQRQDEEVPSGQEEPLDPLGPGGIGG